MSQAMLNVIYAIKACMLIMYSRLTLGHKVQKMVFYLAIYVAIGWLATEIAFFTACRPFNGYWAMPPPNAQCTTLQHYAIVQGCFNITSDCLMLCIPIPLIRKLQMPLKQKAVLLLIFSMGIFVILAALLTKIFNLSNIWDPSYMLWYTRESSVAVYVSNIPMIWPLLREWFPVLLSMTPGHKLSSSTKKGLGYGKNSSKRGTITPGRNTGDTGRGIVTTIRGQGDSMEKLDSRDETEMGPITRQESWGRSDKSDIGLSDRGMKSGIWDGGMDFKDGIQIQTTVEVIEDYVVHPSDGDLSRDLEKGPGNIQWNFKQDEK
jgi:hypothetical protein